jgi:hypothetical protein
MEAATPLRSARVRTLGDRVVADGLVIDDECVVRLVREREERGEDPAPLIVDAVEIGARVLDREQAGANADFVRGELEKVTRDAEQALGERTREFNELIARKVDEAFGAETGVVSKALARHFSDDSSAAVQNRVREVVAEAMTQVQQSIVRQFSSADAQNPLAEFKQGVVRTLQQADHRQTETLTHVNARLAALQQEIGALRAERDKLADLEAERERGTAKGRTFEELVVEEIDRLAGLQGDLCEAVGDFQGATGRVGDVVVGIDGCAGPPRGKIVFEAKNSKLSRPKALAELDKSLQDRDADFAVLVVSSEDKVPAKMRALHEYNGDKMIVTLDPEEGPLGLELAYSLARARVLMRRSDVDGIDAAAISDTVERALTALEAVRTVRSQLTGMQNGLERAKGMLVSMAQQVQGHLEHVNELVATGDGDADDEPTPAEPAQHSLV